MSVACTQKKHWLTCAKWLFITWNRWGQVIELCSIKTINSGEINLLFPYSLLYNQPSGTEPVCNTHTNTQILVILSLCGLSTDMKQCPLKQPLHLGLQMFDPLKCIKTIYDHIVQVTKSHNFSFGCWNAFKRQ